MLDVNQQVSLLVTRDRASFANYVSAILVGWRFVRDIACLLCLIILLALAGVFWEWCRAHVRKNVT